MLLADFIVYMETLETLEMIHVAKDEKLLNIYHFHQNI